MNTKTNDRHGCYQLTEVALHHEAPLTQPTTFEGAVASWRLTVEWLKGQPGWQVIDVVEPEVGAVYATFRMPEDGLYGLWVKAVDFGVVPLPATLQSDRMWLVRSVPIASETTRDYMATETDATPSPDFNISDRYEGGEYGKQESAGV